MQKKRSHTQLYFLLILLFILPDSKIKAQNVSSPYSILGIGDIDTKDYDRYFADGSTAISRRDANSYNFSNPASLTSLPYKLMNFDVAMRGRFSTFQVPTVDSATAISKDLAIKRISMAFKITDKLGIAFGLKPYSSVSYQSEYILQIPDGSSSYIKSVNGTGGINQIYFSVGKELSNHFSVGLTASYLFGSLENTVTYSPPANITLQETNFMYGANLLAGFQYYSWSPKDRKQKRWKHQLGLTVTASTPLNGQLTTDYISVINTADTLIPEAVVNSRFKLPTSIAFGYSATHNDKLILSCEANYSDWPSQFQTLDYTNYYTTSTLRVSAGIEYSHKQKSSRGLEYEKYFLAMGASAENSYFIINSTYLQDYSITAGGGINVSGYLSFYGGFEYGIRGDINKGQIQENYTGIHLGISLKNSWFNVRKFGKFN